jgi:hypothetical protein
MTTPHDADRIRKVLTLALGVGALFMLGLGVYFFVVAKDPLIGGVLVVAGAAEALAAQLLPKILAQRLTERGR